MARSSLFIAAIILGIFSITYAASLKDYDPYAVKKRTTTTPPSTTTTVEMIRHCTCTESQECLQKAWSNITACQEQCKSSLSFFGSDTAAKLKCIQNNPNDAVLAHNCFKTSPGFCATTNSSSQIVKPSYVVEVSNKTKVPEAPLIAAFKSFHICAGECMRNIIIGCFEEKKCGVKLDDAHNIGKLGEFCHTLKASVVASSAKALPCLVPGVKPRRKSAKKQ